MCENVLKLWVVVAFTTRGRVWCKSNKFQRLYDRKIWPKFWVFTFLFVQLCEFCFWAAYLSQWEKLFKKINRSWESRLKVKRGENAVTWYVVGFSIGQVGKGHLEKYVLHFKKVISVPKSQSEALWVIKHCINLVLYTLNLKYVQCTLYFLWNCNLNLFWKS